MEVKKTSKRQEKSRTFFFLVGICLTSLFTLLYLFQPRFFQFLDLKSFDTILAKLPNDEGQNAASPVIVDIDEKSLAKYGQWPWPRYRVALLMDRLRELGPAAVTLDIIFAEADRTSFSVLKEEIFRDLKLKVPLAHIPRSLIDNDLTLADALAKGPFLLGYTFTFEQKTIPTRNCILHPLNLAVLAKEGVASEPLARLYQGKNVVCSIRPFTQKAASSGFLNIPPDMDGVMRRIPLIIAYEGKIYPSLALASLMVAEKSNQLSLIVNSGGIESLRLNSRIIPLDGKGNLLIRYRGKARTFTYISAADVLERKIDREQIARRIVFVGSSAAGIADFQPTPLDTFFPGVEIHATVLDNILKRDFISRPNWIYGLELLAVFSCGLISTFLFTATTALWSLISLVAGALLLWYGSLWFMQAKGIFLSPVVALMALGSNFLLVTLLKYWREEREKKARAKELLLTQDFTIRCLASLTECRDSETGGHILRTQAYVAALCRELSTDPRYAEVLDEETREHLYKSAPLHDIGKVGVPDHILLKPGKLTDEEFEQMKKHTTYGRDAIARAEEKFGIGKSSEFLRLAKEIAYTHHEKWDGTGYPQKLKGEEIPLSGRIMALADVYDALICKRIYKPPFTHEEAVALIEQLNGVLFDPAVISAFLKVHQEFKKISAELADESQQG